MKNTIGPALVGAAPRRDSITRGNGGPEVPELSL
jgi:hypothetical protein